MEYNLAVVMGKKSPSSKKAENKKLQEVFAESQKLKDAVELSISQWGILFGVGVLTATIPCGLMFTAVYSIPADILSKSIAYFGIGVGLTGLVMAMNYNVLSSKEKARLVFGLGADSAKQVQAAFVESSSFAIMLGNFSYFFMYAFFVRSSRPRRRSFRRNHCRSSSEMSTREQSLQMHWRIDTMFLK